MMVYSGDYWYGSSGMKVLRKKNYPNKIRLYIFFY